MRIRFSAAIVLLVAISGNVIHAQEKSQSDNVGRITFYSEKKAIFANQDIVCQLAANQNWRKSLHDRNARDMNGKRCRPDRARTASLVGPVPTGTRILVFKNRDGTINKPGDSSWAEIFIRAGLASGQTLMIGSFEQQQGNSLFSVRSACDLKSDGRRWCPAYNDDFLDGKVSWISVIPPGTEGYDSLPIDAEVAKNVKEKGGHR